MLSVIIPSRNVPTWKFTPRTVEGLFEKATGEIEVIIVLDGYEPDPPLKERKNLVVIHNEKAQGMRQGINAAAKVARGRYIMKCDDHCAFDLGYDEKLAADCDDNWLVVPARYSLDGEAWLAGSNNIKKYGPIHHLYLTYPFVHDDQFGFGLHGKKWFGERGLTGGYFDREKKRKGILIDDILSFQGSCWFMPKDLFFKNGCMQEDGYYQHQEAQELGFKVWLSGGRCVVNKKTWYAHLHKGPVYGRGYHMLNHQKIKSQIYSTEVWMNNKWPGQTRDLKWLIENPLWWPLEGWPENWDNAEFIKGYNYSTWEKR